MVSRIWADARSFQKAAGLATSAAATRERIESGISSRTTPTSDCIDVRTSEPGSTCGGGTARALRGPGATTSTIPAAKTIASIHFDSAADPTFITTSLTKDLTAGCTRLTRSERPYLSRA